MGWALEKIATALAGLGKEAKFETYCARAGVGEKRGYVVRSVRRAPRRTSWLGIEKYRSGRHLAEEPSILELLRHRSEPKRR